MGRFTALGLLGGISVPDHHHCRILHLLPKRTAGTLSQPLMIDGAQLIFDYNRASHKTTPTFSEWLCVTVDWSVTLEPQCDTVNDLTGFYNRKRDDLQQ